MDGQPGGESMQEHLPSEAVDDRGQFSAGFYDLKASILSDRELCSAYDAMIAERRQRELSQGHFERIAERVRTQVLDHLSDQLECSTEDAEMLVRDVANDIAFRLRTNHNKLQQERAQGGTALEGYQLERARFLGSLSPEEKEVLVAMIPCSELRGNAQIDFFAQIEKILDERA